MQWANMLKLPVAGAGSAKHPTMTDSVTPHIKYPLTGLKVDAMLEKWIKLGGLWMEQFQLDPDNKHSESESWIDPIFDNERRLTIGCKCCKAAGLKGAFAQYQVSGLHSLYKTNFKKHHENPNHKKAVTTYMLGDDSHLFGAPPANEFRELADVIMKGQGCCGTRKLAKMSWCLAEAIKSVDQKFVTKAATITLFRDESKGRLAVRFRTVMPDLIVHCGTLGQARDEGTGAFNITRATKRIFQRFSTRYDGAPYRTLKKPFLKKDTYESLCQKTHAITVDSAGDEVLSSEMMRSAALSSMRRALTPNLKFVIRDRTHGSKRLLSRAWAADEYLDHVTKLFCKGRKSVARLIHNSREIRRQFQFYSHTSFRVINKAVRNMRAAPHRYECMQKPFGRTVLFVHACIRTAIWCATTRTDESAARGKEWLLNITDEACLQGAMMADAADQTIVLTRVLDDEEADPIVCNSEVRSYLTSCEALFGPEEKCLKVFGYTRAMLQTLSRPIVWNVGQGHSSIGAHGSVSRDVINQCLNRMRCWLKLMRATLAAEFPSFEITYVLDSIGSSEHQANRSFDQGSKHQIICHTSKLSQRDLPMFMWMLG